MKLEYYLFNYFESSKDYNVSSNIIIVFYFYIIIICLEISNKNVTLVIVSLRYTLKFVICCPVIGIAKIVKIYHQIIS